MAPPPLIAQSDRSVQSERAPEVQRCLNLAISRSFPPGGPTRAGLLAELRQGPRTVTRSGAGGIKAGPDPVLLLQTDHQLCGFVAVCFSFFPQLPERSCEPVRTKLWRALLRGKLAAQTGTTPSRSGRVEGGVWKVEGGQPHPPD